MDAPDVDNRLIRQAVETATALARMARAEDLGAGDLTGQLIATVSSAEFVLEARAAGVMSGVEIVPAVLGAYDEGLEVSWRTGIRDGVSFADPPVALATVRGDRRTVLAAERVLLNFLQRLCGVATVTRAYVDAVRGTGAQIYDTRKTIPGWRALDKYAVRCGGGRNHRMGLYDAALIKDNHLAGVETARFGAVVFDMLNELSRKEPPPTFVEVEADTLEQVAVLLKVVGIDVILLDNFDGDQLHEAVGLRDGAGLRGKVELEASGGITLDNVRAVAESGVERISVGTITHSAPALDLSMNAR